MRDKVLQISTKYDGIIDSIKISGQEIFESSFIDNPYAKVYIIDDRVVRVCKLYLKEPKYNLSVLEDDHYGYIILNKTQKEEVNKVMHMNWEKIRQTLTLFLPKDKYYDIYNMICPNYKYLPDDKNDEILKSVRRIDYVDLIYNQNPIYWSEDRHLRLDLNELGQPYFILYYNENKDVIDVYDKDTVWAYVSLYNTRYYDLLKYPEIFEDDDLIVLWKDGDNGFVEYEDILKILNSPCNRDINITLLQYMRNYYIKHMNLLDIIYY